MRCLGWRFSFDEAGWSSIYSCEERWHPDNYCLTWRQVWEGEVWVMREYSYYTRVDE